jgi:hypothetical protein
MRANLGALARGCNKARSPSVKMARSETMEPVFYVMAILGCGDDQSQCREARVEPVRYHNAAQCQAAMAQVLPRHADLSFPVIVAACQRRGEQMARNDMRAPRG